LQVRSEVFMLLYAVLSLFGTLLTYFWMFYLIEDTRRMFIDLLPDV